MTHILNKNTKIQDEDSTLKAEREKPSPPTKAGPSK